MRILLFFCFIISSVVNGYTQRELTFGLQTGATISSFQTELTISNTAALTIPPINEFEGLANFQIGFWLEKRVNSLLTLKLEVERSPGGAKAFDAFDNRLKRYKFFHLGVPIILKWTAFQSKARFPFQLETGVSANFFLFDYGEAIIFGEVNKLEYRVILGLTKNIDKYWSVSLRYLGGLNAFSTFDSNSIKVDWTNQMYVVSIGRSLFTIKKKAIQKIADKYRKNKKNRKKRR